MRKILISFLILPSLLLARQKPQVHHTGAEIPYELWLTGSFLAPTPVNMKPGHPAIEPALIVLNTYGVYDSSWKLKSEKNIWELNYLVDFQFGITDRTGIEIIGSASTQFLNNKSSTHFTDTIVLFGYQVSDDQKSSWIPDCRLFLQTIFPSGKHDKLDAENPPLDITGQGAFFVGPNLSYQKLFYLPCNFLVLHWSFGYFFPTTADIRNVSTYGGVKGTKGSIRPGQFLSAFFSGEYSFNQRWVFAMDIFFTHQLKTSRFKGKRGISPDGLPARVGLPSSSQLSIAPAIEYNLSSHAGWLFGSWLTLAGQSSPAFASAFVSFLYVF